MSDLTGRGEVDRLPIFLLGLGIEKLLAAPKFSADSGQQMCDATMQTLHDWNIPLNRVVSLCLIQYSATLESIKGFAPYLSNRLGMVCCTLLSCT